MNTHNAEEFAAAVINVLTKPSNLKLLQKALDGTKKPVANSQYEAKILKNQVKFADVVTEKTMRLQVSEIAEMLCDPKFNVFRAGRLMSNDFNIKSTKVRGAKKYYVDEVIPVTKIKKKPKKKKKKKISKVEQDISRKMKERGLS